MAAAYSGMTVIVRCHKWFMGEQVSSAKDRINVKKSCYHGGGQTKDCDIIGLEKSQTVRYKCIMFQTM